MKKVSVEFHDGKEWLEEAWTQGVEEGDVEGGAPLKQIKSILQRVISNAYNYPQTYGSKKTSKHAIVIDGMRFEVKFIGRTD